MSCMQTHTAERLKKYGLYASRTKKKLFASIASAGGKMNFAPKFLSYIIIEADLFRYLLHTCVLFRAPLH